MKATRMPMGTFFHKLSTTHYNTKNYNKASFVAMFPELQDLRFQIARFFGPADNSGRNLPWLHFSPVARTKSTFSTP